MTMILNGLLLICIDILALVRQLVIKYMGFINKCRRTSLLLSGLKSGRSWSLLRVINDLNDINDHRDTSALLNGRRLMLMMMMLSSWRWRVDGCDWGCFACLGCYWSDVVDLRLVIELVIRAWMKAFWFLWGTTFCARLSLVLSSSCCRSLEIRPKDIKVK